MADFLSSFNFGAQEVAPTRDDRCGSVDELLSRLRHVLDTQIVSETRVEHAAATLELRNSVRLALTLSDAENDAIQNLAHADTSSSGGLRSLTPAAATGDGQFMRDVDANDALVVQTNNPTLQRAVAKHLVGAIGVTDGSSWTLRDMKLGDQGWNFKYVCKDSLHEWERQNEKKLAKPVIGEYSFKEQDPALSERPAFDCRGSITLTFDRNSRSIVTTYDHTLFHKTVAQLLERYPPPVRQLGPGALRQLQQKTPKKTSPEKKTRQDSAAKGQNGESSRSKKRRKKNDGQPDTTVSNGQSHYPNDSQPQASMPETLAGSGDGQQSASGLHNARGPQPAIGLIFNVSAEEAARRLHVARALLADAGVNPDTLSEAQMNIFANQSPDLQKDSVAMLAKYGAERLQIVEPNEKEKAGPGQPTSAAAGSISDHVNADSVTTTELMPSAQAQEEMEQGNVFQRVGANSADNENSGDRQRATRKLGKSRLACSSCKARKVKCPKERPACAECEASGSVCKYPPAKPKKSRKSEAIAVDEDETGEDADAEADEDDYNEVQQQLQTKQLDVPQPVETSNTEAHTMQDPASYAQMPVVDMLTPHTEQPAADTLAFHPSHFQSASSVETSGRQGTHSPAMHFNSTATQVVPVESPAQPQRSRRSKRASRDRDSTSKFPLADALGAVHLEMSTTSHGNVSANASTTGLAMPNSRHDRSHYADGLSLDSPQLRNSLRHSANSPQMAAAQQSRHSQQSHNVEGEGGGGGGGAQQGQIPVPVDRWQNKSRQSLRAQSGTPTGDQSGYRTPTSQAAQTMADLRGADNSNLVASTSYNNFGRYGHGSTSSVDQSANCIAYQPYSQQQETTAMSATSYPAFEYSQAAGTQSAVSHMSNDTTAQYNAGDLPAGQWPTNSHNRSLGTFGDSGQSTGTQSGHNLAASSQLQRPLSGGSGSNRKRDNYMQYPAQRQARSQHLGQSQNQNPPNLYNNYGHTNNDAFSSGSNWM